MGVRDWGDPAVGGVTPTLAAEGVPSSSVFSGLIHEHSVAIAGEKGWAAFEQSHLLSEPQQTLGKGIFSFAIRAKAPRLFPEQRGLRAISPSAFPAARAVFLGEPSNCCLQHGITGLSYPRDYPAAPPGQLRAGSLHFTACLLQSFPSGRPSMGRAHFWEDATGTGGCSSPALSIVPPQEHE